MNRLKLSLIVFLCGTSVMIYELVGTRVLAPYLGTSTYIWTSLIGVILGSLSAGYWIGGRIADRKSDEITFAGIIFLAASLIGISIGIKDFLLSIIELKIHDDRIGALLASLVLFAPASLLLGMVSPYAVKLRAAALDKIGAHVGELYALSTIGSIFGTFLAGFYLIPRFGTNLILVMLTVTLSAVAVLSLSRGMIVQKSVMCLYCFIILYGGKKLTDRFDTRPPLVDTDTEYSRVQISDEYILDGQMGRWSDVRVMKLGNVINSGVYLDNPELFLPYTRFFRLVQHFRPETKNALMIGGGALVYPRDFLRNFPAARMDVVEIDSRLTQLAHQYFGFRADSRLQLIHQDGRTYLNRTLKRYDAIFCDAFSSYSIPYQLTTRESVSRMHRLLEEGGVVLVNVISAIEGDRGKFLRAEYATFKSVFPQVYLFPNSSSENGQLVQNIMLVAIKGTAVPAMRSDNDAVNKQLGKIWKKGIQRDLPLLTDDFAPVEHYVGYNS